MMESNNYANIAANKLSKREILKDTKSLCMMESNAYTNIADIKQTGGVGHLTRANVRASSCHGRDSIIFVWGVRP